MTRTKLSLVAFLLVTLLGACGGRSTLKITVDGGNAAADGGAGLDSKRDGTVTTDAASSNDTSVSDALSAADVSIGDAARAEAASDSARTDLLSDLLSDGRPVPDGGDAGGVDAARNDTRNGDSGDAAGDGPATLVGPAEATGDRGRPPPGVELLPTHLSACFTEATCSR